MAYSNIFATIATLLTMSSLTTGSSICSAGISAGRCITYSSTGLAPYRNITTGEGADPSSQSVDGTAASDTAFGTTVQASGIRTANGVSTGSNTITNIPVLLSEAVPSPSTITAVVSGATTIERVLVGNGETSPITLGPVPSTTLRPSGTQAVSKASSMSNQLMILIGTVTSFDHLPTATRHAVIGPVLKAIENVEHDAEDFIDDLGDDKSSGGGCTASLFNILSCAVKDLESLSGAIDGVGTDVVKNLVDHLSGLAKALTETSENDDDNQSSSTSSSTCDMSTTVQVVHGTCTPTYSASSLVLTCQPETTTISGCSLTGTTSMTTLTTSTATRPSSAPMTLEQYPGPQDDGGDRKAVSAELYSHFLSDGLLPIRNNVPGTNGFGTGTAPWRSGVSTTAPRRSGASTNSTTVVSSTLTTIPPNTAAPSITTLFTSAPSCSFVSVTISTLVQTLCACNGVDGSLTTVAAPSGSSVACAFQDGTTLSNFPITTLSAASSTPTAIATSSIDIVLANYWHYDDTGRGVDGDYPSNAWAVLDLQGQAFDSANVCDGRDHVGPPIYQIATLQASQSAAPPAIGLSASPTSTPMPIGTSMPMIDTNGNGVSVGGYTNCQYIGSADGPGQLACDDLVTPCAVNENTRVECSPTKQAVGVVGTSFWPVVACVYEKSAA